MLQRCQQQLTRTLALTMARSLLLALIVRRRSLRSMAIALLLSSDLEPTTHDAHRAGAF